jgi:uncharacterized protein (TIGR02391 family)
MPALIPMFSAAQIEAISKVLGDTHTGLTGSEIGRLLASCAMGDPLVDATKWRRIAQALATQQDHDGSGTCVIKFIEEAMAPVRHVQDPKGFEGFRLGLNEVLSFSGLELAQDGSMRRRTPAKTLSEAAARTKRLHGEMLRRGVHRDVLRFCQEELLEEDCFDAVFEATKGLAERIREMTGLTHDGARLIDAAFARGQSEYPLMALNTLTTESEQSEQSGLANLMKGVIGTFRNPAAHAPKIKWPVSEADALDLLTVLSLVHRRLDLAVVLSTEGGG